MCDVYNALTLGVVRLCGVVVLSTQALLILTPPDGTIKDMAKT